MVVVLTLLVGGAAASGSTAESRRVIVRIELLEVEAGSRLVAEHRLVIDVGMAARLELAPLSGTAGRRAWGRAAIEVGTSGAAGGRVRIDVRSVLMGGRADGTRHAGRLRLASGTSGLLEIAGPRGESGARLVLSVTLIDAPDEPLAIPPVRIEFEIQVIGESGADATLLQSPHLRTFSGDPVDFDFEYQVPAAVADGFDRVRFALRLTPSHPRAGRLPVRFEVTGDYPAAAGQVLVSRALSAVLAAGEPWTHRFEAGEGVALRLTVRAAWAEF